MDNKEIVRFGIIGFGNMGSAHAANLYNGNVPQAKLVAVCDISEQQLEAARKLYPDIKCYISSEELMNDSEVDAVLVATPHYSHPSLAKEALTHDKHVLVEKPAGVYTKQVLEMNELAAKSNKVFGIMYNMRVFPVYKKVKNLIDSGELGGLKRITWITTAYYRPQCYHDSCTWRSTWRDEGGGTLINQHPHQLDLWQWMFGVPDSIHAFCEYGKYYKIEVEDEVVAHMKYDNGVTGVYIASTGETPGTNRLEIACDMGKLVVNDGETITFYKNEVSERIHNANNRDDLFAQPPYWKCEIPVDGVNESHVGIMKNFSDAILKGKNLIAPGEDGIFGLTISNAMHYSSWTGETVSLKDFPHDEFYKLLQEKIEKSTVVKEERQRTVGIDGSY